MTRKIHNADHEATAFAHFADIRSYITKAGHQFLFGDDARRRRQEIYESAKGGQCQIRISPKCDPEPGWYGHLHHIKGGNTDDRCWCEHNLCWSCPACHYLMHPQTQFGKSTMT